MLLTGSPVLLICKLSLGKVRWHGQKEAWVWCSPPLCCVRYLLSLSWVMCPSVHTQLSVNSSWVVVTKANTTAKISLFSEFPENLLFGQLIWHILNFTIWSVRFLFILGWVLGWCREWQPCSVWLLASYLTWDKLSELPFPLEKAMIKFALCCHYVGWMRYRPHAVHSPGTRLLLRGRATLDASVRTLE